MPCSIRLLIVLDRRRRHTIRSLQSLRAVNALLLATDAERQVIPSRTRSPSRRNRISVSRFCQFLSSCIIRRRNRQQEADAGATRTESELAIRLPGRPRTLQLYRSSSSKLLGPVDGQSEKLRPDPFACSHTDSRIAELAVDLTKARRNLTIATMQLGMTTLMLGSYLPFCSKPLPLPLPIRTPPFSLVAHR